MSACSSGRSLEFAPTRETCKSFGWVFMKLRVAGMMRFQDCSILSFPRQLPCALALRRHGRRQAREDGSRRSTERPCRSRGRPPRKRPSASSSPAQRHAASRGRSARKRPSASVSPAPRKAAAKGRAVDRRKTSSLAPAPPTRTSSLAPSPVLWTEVDYTNIFEDELGHLRHQLCGQALWDQRHLGGRAPRHQHHLR